MWKKSKRDRLVGMGWARIRRLITDIRALRLTDPKRAHLREQLRDARAALGRHIDLNQPI